MAGLGESVAAAVRSFIPENRLEAVVLGGGYGRGEGGVLKTEAGDRFYNDLEFYVFVQGPRLLNDARLFALSTAPVENAEE